MIPHLLYIDRLLSSVLKTTEAIKYKIRLHMDCISFY